MALSAEDFYRSSNGDRWQLIRDIWSRRRFLRIQPVEVLSTSCGPCRHARPSYVCAAPRERGRYAA
jgi:hypothetical protein